MMRAMPLILNIFSGLCLLGAVLAVLLLKGIEQHVVARVFGVLLVLSTIAGRQFTDNANSDDQDGRLYKYGPTRLLLIVRDFFSAISIVAGLAIGYLIYFSSDDLPGRKTYIIVIASLILGTLAGAYFLSYLIRRRATSHT
jgi:hypothetical protein